MDKRIFHIILWSLIVTSYGYCPQSKIKAIGTCSYSVECVGTIRDVNISATCERLGHSISIVLTLKDAIERFEDDILNANFLGKVTTLSISGRWNDTALAILSYMPVLKYLYLHDNNISHVTEKPFNNLVSLTHLDMSHNKLVNVKGLFKFRTKRSKLRRLFLSHNEIEELPKDSFEQLEYLIELDLSYNNIQSLVHRPFHKLKLLRVLKLDSNKLSELDGSLNHLSHLKHLHLRDNQLRAIDDDIIAVVQHLQTFDVSDNDIDILKTTVFLRNIPEYMPKPICKMLLSKNNIVNIPNATITHARNVVVNNNFSVELDLSENDITDVAYNAFEGLNKIVSLDLSSNQLEDFFVKSQDLSDIKHLNLSYNYLNMLFSESFSSMVNLEILDLSYNSLEFIPNYTFSMNYNLKRVNITNNKMIVLKSLNIALFHNQGGMLDLSNNELAEISMNSGEGIRLRTLILNSNNITDTCKVDLEFQAELRELELTKNNIQMIEENCVRLPSSLIYLDLSNNNIDTIKSSSFIYLRKLQTIRLSNNNLEKLSYGAFRGLEILKNLDLSYNKLIDLDAGLFSDLKLLRVLSLRHNQLVSMDYQHWISHDYSLTVYLEGNNFTCEWLTDAVYNNENGWSNMIPTALERISSEHFVQDIPCIPVGKEVAFSKKLGASNTVLADDRLLVTNRRILDQIMFQNDYLKTILDRLMEKDDQYLI